MRGWPPRDWRAMMALVFSVFGAAVLTGVATWLCLILSSSVWTVTTEATRARSIGTVAIIAMVAVGLVLLGLGMAVNRRKLEGKWGDRSIQWEGGEEPPPVRAARETAEAAQHKAEEIAEEGG